MIKLTRPMVRGKSSHILVIATLLATLLPLPMAAPADSIRITWDPERVKPGSVVPLRVHTPVPLMAAEAGVEAERFPLMKMESGDYLALVGVDLNHKETVLPVDFALFPSSGGAPYRIRADLRIKKAPAAPPVVQRLTLPTGMVDFSPPQLEKVRSDNRTLGETLAARTRDRFWGEGFILPLRGRITTRFGTGRILNGKPRSPHSGVDIAGSRGTAVKASNAGQVLMVDEFYLSGRTVVLDHGWGVSTVYAHLDTVSVSEGQFVLRGQSLGTVGSTGRATGPHLHFGAFIRGAKVDPLQLIEVTRDF
ncbi:MAG: M23 family metallopeptidase [bacterium]|nr:MAG: M23 family metallopeptidase [bacterium]